MQTCPAKIIPSLWKITLSHTVELGSLEQLPDSSQLLSIRQGRNLSAPSDATGSQAFIVTQLPP